MAARNRQVSLLELDGTSLCVYVQTKENPLSAEELHWWTIHRQQCEVQVSRWWLYSRWAWELLWQLKAREKINPHHIWRLFTNSGFRTKSARDQPPNQGGPQGMSIFINFRQHVGLLCAQERTFHPIGGLTMKPANRWKSFLWLSCFRGKVSHGKTKKVRLCRKRAVEEINLWGVCV